MEKFVDSLLKKNLALVLFEYRVEHDFSRKELAYELGISLNSLSSIENGKSVPSLETLYKYSLFFNTKISRIIERAETYGI